MDGDIAESRVSTELMKLGCYVSPTYSEQAPYDIVADIGGELIKVQVKKGLWIPERNQIQVVLHRKGHEPYTKDEVDAFAIYNEEDDEIYWLWFNEAPNTPSRTKETWRKDLLTEKISTYL